MANSHSFFASLNCPQQVTWTNDIKKMFTALDIAHMKPKGIDLSSYDSVKINAVPIYDQVSQGSMPPPGSGETPWSPAWVNTFACWIKQNCPQ